MLAHEIRNLLTPMRVRAQMALERPGQADAHAEALGYAIATADRISAVTDAILFIGSESTPATAIPIAPLLRDLRDVLSGGSGDRPRVNIEIEDDLTVSTNPTALRHILLNLLANADRASSLNQGGVSVSAERSTWNTSLGVTAGARFTIRDDGPGMDRQILQRFNQIGDERATETDDHVGRYSSGDTSGAGVGLRVVQHLVNLIGGDVHACNLAGGGASLTLLVPDLPVGARSNRSRAA